MSSQRKFTVEELLEHRKRSLRLELLTPGVSLYRTISSQNPSSPGLELAGFTERMHPGRVQVYGETEMGYLRTLDTDTQRQRLERVLTEEVPAVFVTKGQEIPQVFLDVAESRGIPVFRSGLSTGLFFRRLNPYLESALAPRTHLHGSLADVYGVGLLFVGQSGIGKSECVLDLVERGHRLVADDLVVISRRGHDILLGEGHELQRHHMEIRGVGIIDIRALFGIRAIRQQKRIEVIVQLIHWDDEQAYNRSGLEKETATILDVELPKVTIPLNPGKNITVISEVVAMNHLLKYSGVDSAVEFDRKLRESMRPIQEYLEEDYE